VKQVITFCEADNFDWTSYMPGVGANGTDTTKEYGVYTIENLMDRMNTT